MLPASAQAEGRPGAEGRGPTVAPRAVSGRRLASAFTASVSSGDLEAFLIPVFLRKCHCNWVPAVGDADSRRLWL